MQESLLHFVWKYQLFSREDMFTHDSEKLEIINPGVHNHNQGPDFLNAKIKIGETLWVGNVEIHIDAEDWFNHKHHNDPKYGNVILHVVYGNLSHKKYPKHLPHFVLDNYIKPKTLDTYYGLMHSASWIPCISQIQQIDAQTKDFWKERLVVERLEERFLRIEEILIRNNWDWEQTFFEYLSRYFGFNKNNNAFESLAQSVSYKNIQKLGKNVFQIESLLFGQAGLISGRFSEEYPNLLKKEYKFLKNKHNLNHIAATFWNFSKMRPANFPTIRISQLANLLSKEEKLFSKILETEKVDELFKFFESNASKYWNKHYVFDEETPTSRTKKLGRNSIEGIIINVAIPFIFSYGKEKDNYAYVEKALNFLNKLDAEKNSILTRWESLGFTNKNAADSQALLYLKKSYCNQKKCLDCGIGTKILKK